MSRMSGDNSVKSMKLRLS